MTVHRLAQLSCEKDPAHVYPDPPAENVTVAELRDRAFAAGWEVGRSGGNGREVCPNCLIDEIKHKMEQPTPEPARRPVSRAPRQRAATKSAEPAKEPAA